MSGGGLENIYSFGIEQSNNLIRPFIGSPFVNDLSLKSKWPP